MTLSTHRFIDLSIVAGPMAKPVCFFGGMRLLSLAFEKRPVCEGFRMFVRNDKRSLEVNLGDSLFMNECFSTLIGRSSCSTIALNGFGF